MVSAASFPHVFETPDFQPPSARVPVVQRTKASVALVPSAELAGILAEDAADGFLTVRVPAPKPNDRGHLALLLEEAIEVALERHGGSPPGLLTESDLGASLADQLYRARLLEFRGLTIALGPLAALVGSSGTLDLEDSAALRFWCDTPSEWPVRLVLDAENALIGVYGPPRPLGELVPNTTDADDADDAPDSDVRASGDDGDGPVEVGELAHALLETLANDAPASADAPAETASVEPAPLEPAPRAA